MTFRVRDAVIGDAETIAGLLDQLGYPATVEDVVSRFAEHARAGGIAIVAVEPGVGEGPIALASMFNFPSLHASGPAALITSLVVAAPARGRGVGRALMLELELRARARGCTRLLVTSAFRREDAHAFYEACGLERTGVRLVKKL